MKRTAYAVFCYGDPSIGHMGCGRVFMTRDQYMQQMSRPDSTWRCPECNFEADFDDDNYEEIIEDEQSI